LLFLWKHWFVGNLRCPVDIHLDMQDTAQLFIVSWVLTTLTAALTHLAPQFMR
jgi:hypothetical protein